MSKHTYPTNRISRKSIRSIGTRPQEGQGLVEYSLLLGLIAVAVIAVISVLGVQLNDTFTSVTSSLGGTSVPYTPGATVQAAATTAPSSSNTGGSGNSVSSGSSSSGSSTSGSSTSGGGSATAPATTAAATTAPIPTTAAPTATPVPTTAPATTAAPTTAASTTAAPTTAVPTATTKPTTAAPTTAPATTAAPTTAASTTAAPTTPAGSGLYTVAYNKTNQWYTWNNGTPIATTYEVNVVITNKSSSTVNSWSISWKLENNESFYNYWNANCVISGSTITCTNPSGYNTVMAPNGTVSFYVQLNSSNMNYTVPKSYTVNGTNVAA